MPKASTATKYSDKKIVGSIPQATFLWGRWTQSWRQRLVILNLISSDVFLAFLAWGAASIPVNLWGHGIPSQVAVASTLAFIVVWIGMRALLGLYPGYGLNQAEELRRQTYAVIATISIAAIFALAFQIGDALSRLLLTVDFLVLLILAPPMRHVMKLAMTRAEFWGKPVAIMGAGESGERLVRSLKRERGFGYRPVFVFDNRQAPVGGMLEGVPYGGTLTNAVDLAREQGIDTAIFAMPQIRRKHLIEFTRQINASFHHVIVVPDLAGVVNTAAVAKDLAGTFGVEITYNLQDPRAKRAKRILDLLGVVVGGGLISPLLLTIAIMIKLSSSGPVFYKQKRLGVGGAYFDCWKFRTMRADAERSLTTLLRDSPNLRAEWENGHKLRDDPRVTRIGRFLRKTSLDELPQLWNVLRGEMSLVGPRPIVEAETRKYGQAYSLYQQVAPGISGLWQVNGRSDTSYEERVAMDTYYVRNWSVWLDLVILTRTVGSTIFGKGAC